MEDTFGKIFKDEINCIVVGDYNFDNKQDYENQIKKYGFYDIILEKF